jgi:DNA-binding response OmpR family regulator
MPTVAIIDDDHSTNDRIRALLKNVPDIKIKQAYDGPSAEVLLKDHFDIVILDIDLGDGPKGRHGGFDLLAGLRGKKTTTLVVSGMQEDNLTSISITLRAYDFIEKPFADIDFLNKFEHALEAQMADPLPEEVDGTKGWPADLEVDANRIHGLKWKGKAIGLSITQSALVHCLLKEIGKPVPQNVMTKQLKSSNSIGAVASHLTAARKKFRDADPDFNRIGNEPGLGYVWKNEE